MTCADGEIVVYVDADSFFFSDPIPAIQESLKNADVALSPHFFPPEHKDRERTCGKWNYGCAAYRACDLTRQVVGEWLEQTLAQCDENANNQHHLKDWPEKLGNRLAELPRGVNCGPWSLPIVKHRSLSYTLPEDGPNALYRTTELISFHAHEFRRGHGPNPVILKGEEWNRSWYDIEPDTIEHVYLKYESELEKFLP